MSPPALLLIIPPQVEQLTESYESKLRQEREATLRLKFENGIKKRTFTSLTKVGSSFRTKGGKKLAATCPHFPPVSISPC